METIILLLCLVALGALFSAAFVRFFQGKKRDGYIWSVLFVVAMVVFYWAIAQEIIALPEQG